MGPSQPLKLSPERVFEQLRQAASELGVRAWVVGGYVRDRLLGRQHPDLDVVVEEGRGLELAEHFAYLVGARRPALFERFGTAQVELVGQRIEFVSARSESYTADSRKPVVRPASIEDDLRRRDFTVNAILMDLDGQVHDPLGQGLGDLEARLLRTPLDPETTFSDDPLRMLRAIRFSAELGFELEPSLLPAMQRLRERLRPPVLSVERITDELRKMLVSERPRLALDLMDQARLLDVVLPELAMTKGVEQGGWHTHDVYGHTLGVIEASPANVTARLAALFHDVGKPATAAPDGSFHGHDLVGAEMAEDALLRLRFSNAEAAKVSRLVRLHMRPIFYQPDWGDGAVRRLARDAGPLLEPLLDLARADIAASAFPHPEKLDDLGARLKAVMSERPSRLSLPVDGSDIMRTLGLPPGREVGRVKERLEELLLDGSVPPDRDAVLSYLKEHPELGA
jgi:poly(A) polymerase